MAASRKRNIATNVGEELVSVLLTEGAQIDAVARNVCYYVCLLGYCACYSDDFQRGKQHSILLPQTVIFLW